jgi:hypothetical protein
MISIISLLVFSQCCTNKETTHKKTPFVIIESFQQDWIGGVPGVFGTTIQLIVDNSKSKVVPLSVYYQGRKENIDIKNSNEGSLWVANFSNQVEKDIKKDIIMSDNPLKEYGNTPPKIEDLPFDIGDKDIFVSYTYKDKTRFYKLLNVSKKQALFFPSTKPKN